MTAPELLFLAPPPLDPGSTEPVDDAGPAPRRSMQSRRSAPPGGPDPRSAPALRMTRGARAAATGMKVADADVQRCIDAPDDVSPDPNTPSRTRFRRGELTVVAGEDGMVLRVDRRTKRRKGRRP
jgi:hypothetical protein